MPLKLDLDLPQVGLGTEALVRRSCGFELHEGIGVLAGGPIGNREVFPDLGDLVWGADDLPQVPASDQRVGRERDVSFASRTAPRALAAEARMAVDPYRSAIV